MAKERRRRQCIDINKISRDVYSKKCQCWKREEGESTRLVVDEWIPNQNSMSKVKGFIDSFLAFLIKIVSGNI